MFGDDHEGRIARLEERQQMTDEAVTALEAAQTKLAADIAAYTTATNQTIADILAHEAGGGTITGAELAPITAGLEALATAVETATATVAGEDPGAVEPKRHKPTYVHDVEGSTEGWTPSGLQEPAKPEVPAVPATETEAEVPAVPAVPAVPLWYFDADTEGGEPTGAVEGVWTVYTGPVQEVPAA